MADFDPRSSRPNVLTGSLPAGAQAPSLERRPGFTPLEDLAAVPTAQKLVSHALRFDTQGAKPDLMLKDPSLRHLALVTQLVADISVTQRGRFNPLPLHDGDKRNEIALWVTRNLHAHNQQPTTGNVSTALNDLLRDRRVLHEISLFEGRNTLLVAHAESWPQVNMGPPSAETDTRTRSLITLTKDTNRFGSTALRERLQEAIGPGPTLTLLRPEQTLERRLFELLQINHDLLGRWSEPPGSHRYVSDGEIKLLKEGIRGILGLPADRQLSLSFRAGMAGSVELGQFSVTGSDDRLLAACAMTLKNFRPVEMVIDRRGDTQYLLSPQMVKEEALRQIPLTRPGPKGFLFIFDGHGAPDALCLIDGQPMSDTTVHRTKDTVVITPHELAEAIIARAKNFPGSHRDVYYLGSCYSKDFIDQVNGLLGGRIIPPIFIGHNEFGQYGYGDYSAAGTRLNTELLDYDRALRGSQNRAATVGDAAELFLYYPQRFHTNPVILAPAQDPRNPIRPLKILNQSASSDRGDGGSNAA